MWELSQKLRTINEGVESAGRKGVELSWEDVQKNLGRFQNLFKQNFLIVDNSKTLGAKQAQNKFNMLVKKGVDKFIKKPIKNPIAKQWIEKQKILKKQGA